MRRSWRTNQIPSAPRRGGEGDGGEPEVAPLVDGEQDRGEGGAESEGAAEIVGLVGRRVAGVGHEQRDQRGGGEHQRHPEPEHGAPAPEVDEGAADHRPQHERRREPHGVPAEDPASLVRRERKGREGRAAAEQECVPRALQDPRGEQPAEGGRERAEDEGGRAPEEARDEHPLVPITSASRPSAGMRLA